MCMTQYRETREYVREDTGPGRPPYLAPVMILVALLIVLLIALFGFGMGRGSSGSGGTVHLPAKQAPAGGSSGSGSSGR